MVENREQSPLFKTYHGTDCKLWLSFSEFGDANTEKGLMSISE